MRSEPLPRALRLSTRQLACKIAPKIAAIPVGTRLFFEKIMVFAFSARPEYVHCVCIAFFFEFLRDPTALYVCTYKAIIQNSILFFNLWGPETLRVKKVDTHRFVSSYSSAISTS